MPAGTKYEVKQELLDAIVALIYKNEKNEVSALDVQQACCDMVESLWGGNLATIVIDNYQDLINLVQLGELTPGATYEFEYQCIHTIPNTTVLNIDSPNFVANPETFYLKALSPTTLSPVAVSKENPQDIILFDYSQSTTETGGVDRTGKVVYRKSQTDDLEAAYDWRGVLNRRYRINYTYGADVAPAPNNNIQQNFAATSAAVKGELVRLQSNGKLYIAGMDIASWSGSTTGQIWNADHNIVNTEWLWNTQVSIMGKTLHADLANFEDVLTFRSGCQRCSIGETTSNFGYNNITFVNCDDVVIASDSRDGFLELVSNNDEQIRVQDSMIAHSTDLSASEIIGTILWDTDHMRIKDITQSSIYWSHDVTIGANSTLIFGELLRASTLGANSNTLYAHYMNESTLGHGNSNNYIRNFVSSKAGNSFDNNTVIGVLNCTFENRVRNCEFNATNDVYDAYEYVYVGNNCSELFAEVDSTVSNVTFNNGCARVTVPSGGTILNTEFGPDCSDFVLESGCTINECDFSPAFKGVTLSGGSSLQNTTFETTNDAQFVNLILEAGASIVNSNIRFRSQNFAYTDVPASSEYYIANNQHYDLELDEVVYLQLTNGSSIYQIKSGVNFSLALNNGSGMNKCVFKDNTTISMDNGAIFEDSNALQAFNLTMDNGVLQRNRMDRGVTFIMNTSGGGAATVQDCTFGAGFTNKTFTNGLWQKQEFYLRDGIAETYDLAVLNPIAGGLGVTEDTFNTSPVTWAFYIVDPKDLMVMNFTADIAYEIDASMFPVNRPFKVALINNTGGAGTSMDITASTGSLNVNIDANDAVVELMRVKSAAKDELVVLGTYTMT